MQLSYALEAKGSKDRYLKTKESKSYKEKQEKEELTGVIYYNFAYKLVAIYS